MEVKSGVHWTDYSLNFWVGCKKVSEACKNCYMFREMKRFGRNPNEVVRTKTHTWNKPYRVKEPSMFFVCSWSDFYIEEADEWRAEAWSLMRDNPQHIFQILTKRPERIMSQMPVGGLPKNVWIGISTENQQRFDERIDYLYGFPAAVKFISVEPMLGLLNLGKHTEVLNWVIAGGESGGNARPSYPDWFRGLRDDCVKYNIPFFFKQWGEFAPPEMFKNLNPLLCRALKSELVSAPLTESTKIYSYPMVRPGTRKAGNLLDGKKWEEFPKYERSEA